MKTDVTKLKEYRDVQGRPASPAVASMLKKMDTNFVKVAERSRNERGKVPMLKKKTA